MIKLYSIFLSLLCCNGIQCAPFFYDRAIHKAQQGKWKESQEYLQKLLVDRPDDSDFLYDAGVASTQCKDFSQAHAYFIRAADLTQNNKQKEQAYFNAGNMSVALKKLEDAIVEYEKALEINSDNEYVQYNYEQVKKMLEQQKQQEQNQLDKQQEKNQQEQEQESKGRQGADNDSNDQTNRDQSESSSGSDEKNQDNNQNNKDKKDSSQAQQQRQLGNENEDHRNNEKNNQKKSNSLDKSGHDQKGNDGRKSGDRTQSEDHGQDDEQRQQKNNEQRNRDKDSNDPFEKIKNKDKGEHGQEHNKTSAEQGTQSKQDTTPRENGQGEALEPWIANVLQQQENHDKQVNKQLMGAKFLAHSKKNGQYGGKNVQNAW